MASVDPVAIVALVVSLVALLIAAGQLLQQYFGTADGYRRCQKSVMGRRWGAMTKLHFRWREFRFETLYCVPRISVEFETEHVIDNHSKFRIWNAYLEQTELDSEKVYLMFGEEPLRLRMQDDVTYETSRGNGEMVCWVPLVDRLEITQSKLKSFYPVMEGSHNTLLQSTGPPLESRDTQIQFQDVQLSSHRPQFSMQGIGASSTRSRLHTAESSREIPLCATATVPGIQICRRSWDFMPADMVRPFCLSTISDVVSLALRLGMKWKQFEPGNGTLMAEGAGHLLTSRRVNSIGICLEYTATGSTEDTFHDLHDVLQSSYLPIKGVYDLAFGIVPGNRRLCCRDWSIGSFEKISESLDLLDNTIANQALSQRLKDAMSEKPGWIPGFNDVIPLVAPKLSQKTSLLCNIPMPNTFAPGIFRSKHSLAKFTALLEKRRPHSKIMKKVLGKIKSLEANHELWKADDIDWSSLSTTGQEENDRPELRASRLARSFAYQDEVHGALDETESDLATMNTTHSKANVHFYETLVKEHIRMAILSHKNAMQNEKEEAIKTEKKAMEDEGVERYRSFLQARYGGHFWLVITMDEYWKGLADLTAIVAAITDCTVEQAADAWVMMIFRAYCWHHCHRLIPQTMILPVEWHDSQALVYIG